MPLRWVDLHPLARDGDGEQFLLDSSLSALSRSRNPSLHAAISAEVPTVFSLCQALDAHGVDVPYDVEWRLMMAYRLA
jgi:hypothetical protein